MSNWTAAQQNASTFTVVGGNVGYYQDTTSLFDGYAGRLPSGTTVTVEYDAEKDAMKIISCSSNYPAAIGSYIRSPKTSSGSLVLDLTSTKATTEAKVTIDASTNKSTPQNTDSEGNTSNSDSTILSELTEMDDGFADVYSAIYTSTEEYSNNLKDGLRVSSLRGILGMPHQFTPITDPRLDSNTLVGDNDAFGRVYSEKIIKQIPLLLMTPGTPAFMTSYTYEQKSKVIDRLSRLGLTDETFDSIFSDGKSGKYYSLKFAYTEYFYYVNAMLRSAAYFLDIQDEKIDNKSLGTINWMYTTANMDNSVFNNENTGIFSHGKLTSFLGPYSGCIAFYADAGTTVDDSFSNSTTESQLASGLNNLSEQGRELNFLIGNVGGMAGVKLDTLTGADSLDATIGDIQSRIDKLMPGKSNIFSNILGKATTILAGGRVVFPEIWSDSSFSRSYSCSMKLVSPSGDKLSVYLNILVPIYHLLGFTLPRESTNQAYFSPFLVRAYYKGLFNVDMGIIPGLTITKGDEGETI